MSGRAPGELYSFEGGGSVIDWPWPASPAIFVVYDKYADVEVSLKVGADAWEIPVQGRSVVFNFAPGKEGLLQQKLVILTQARRSPSSISKFTRSLLSNWPLYLQLLQSNPLALIWQWDELVHTIDCATAGKTILKLAAQISVGPWTHAHKDLIKGLDTKANAAARAQRRRVSNRELLLDLDTQSALINVLDTHAMGPAMLEWQSQGLTALTLLFQHGMRAVQLLALRVEHVQIFEDADGSPVCVLSFHTAKQPKDSSTNREIARQVKPEWVPPVTALLGYAKRAGRSRLFSSTNAEQLWGDVKRVCAQMGVKVDFSAYRLRHTSAQALADAGYSRKSIQRFLGHSSKNAAVSYLRGSRHQAQLINTALGVSKLYGRIASLASGEFVTVDQLREAQKDHQIGAVVGNRLVAGIGLCQSGQPNCTYNPVTSCYGCRKFLPALDASAHLEAIAGMREQVIVYLNQGGTDNNPAYLQLAQALSGAQKALDEIKRIKNSDV